MEGGQGEGKGGGVGRMLFVGLGAPETLGYGVFVDHMVWWGNRERTSFGLN